MPSTGMRDLKTLLSTDVVGGTIRVIRTGPVVTVSIYSLQLIEYGGSLDAVVTLPSGFRPPLTMNDNITGPDSSAQIIFSYNGDIGMNRKREYSVKRVTTFLTTDAWPTSLPGESV